MKQFLIKNRNYLIAGFLAILSLFLAFFNVPTTHANAEETTNSESTTITAQDVIDNSWYIGFSKCENETVGKALFINYFINEGYWSTDNFTYGVLIFPQAYYTKYITQDDYISEFTAQNAKYLNVTGTGKYEVTGGYIVRFGLSNILEQNLPLQFCYVFYVKDNTTSQYVYAKKQLACYNTLTQDGSVDLMQYKTVDEYNALKTKMQAQIDELEATIEEDGSIDLDQYVTKTSYDSKVSELNTKITALEKENAALKGVEEKTGLSFVQILGIVAGAIAVLIVVGGIASISKKKKSNY